ncbi:MAG: SHOCT domain-containing protein [Actinomycetia bacterium]|nr:SHOCT domain-containing protein [Actinomycetes bacterium]
MMYGYGWWGPMGFIFMIFMIGFVAFAAWLIIRGVQPSTSARNDSRALAELADRYARGEIDGAEFRARKLILEEAI